MQLETVLYFLFWAGLFFVMMRFGCGAHVMGHMHHRDGPEKKHEPSDGGRTPPLKRN
jgi:hypothetical protein